MAIIDKYPAGTLASTDYLIGVDRSNENVTRNIPVSEISAVILASKGVSTVSSIKTESSPFINLQITQGGLAIPPAFLHDYFVTKSWAICIDHSLRADPGKLTTTGYFDWDRSRNLRLGVFPRDAASNRT